MNEKHDDRPPSEDAIRYIAAKGEAALDRIQRVLDRAKAMLARGEVAEPADGIDPLQHLYLIR